MLDLISLPFWLAGLWLLRVGLSRAALRLSERDRLGPAAICNGLALLIWPASAPLLTRQGNLLGDLGRWRAARGFFALARRLRPDWIEAWLGLAVAALVLETGADQGAETAHACFLRAYCLRRGTPVNLADQLENLLPQAEPEHLPAVPEKLIHDADQLQLLVDQAMLPLRWEAEAKAYRQEALKTLPGRPESYQHGIWLAQPAATGNPLRPLAASRIEAAYAATGVAWHDGLLQNEALEQLLQFCQYSTIWHHAYANGYLGAHLDDGMSCPLLYQIAAALRQVLPGIFADTRLVYLWAFKCRDRVPGVAMHHDSALVNVNLWLTPDRANRDPERGGIRVWPKEPPAAWDLERYRIAPATMAAWVEGVAPVVVPYRQNRAVIFNSRLFHATDAFDFEPGYLNQRINVTLLFGRAPLRYHPKLELKP